MQNQVKSNEQLTLEKLGRSVDILCSEVEGILKKNEEHALDGEFSHSFTRMIFIMVAIYFTLYGYMTLINVDNAYLHANVPTIGYNMSTWSLPYVKCLWMTFKEKTETNLAVHLACGTGGTGDTIYDEMDALETGQESIRQ